MQSRRRRLLIYPASYAGAEINMRDARGLMPLDHALRRNNKKAREALCKAGAADC